MRDINSLTKSKMEKAWAVNSSMTCKPSSMQATTQRVVHILDTKYEKADLQSVVSTNCTHLSLQDTNNLLELLTELEELFDGKLGDWNTKTVSFELNEGAEPYHGKQFPVPRVHKDTIIKELNRLCVNWECWSFSPHQNGHHPPP
jgi:hypothetical protein